MYAVSSFSKVNTKQLDKTTKNLTKVQAERMLGNLADKGTFAGAYCQYSYVSIGRNYTCDRVGTNKRIKLDYLVKG